MEGQALPEWVHILPLPDSDGRIPSRDFRTLIVKDVHELVRTSNAALERQGGGGPVDLDHRLYRLWGGGGPAAAWAEKFEVRSDGVYAKMSWLPEAAEAVQSRQYRYTSAVVRGKYQWHYDEDGWPSTLDVFPETIEGFGLVNTPALETRSLFSAERFEAFTSLGFSRDEAASLAALEVDALRHRWTGSSPKVAELETALAAAKEQITAAQDQLAATQRQQLQAEAERLMTAAQESGRLTPASAAVHRRRAVTTEDELADLRDLLATLPVWPAAPTTGATPTTSSKLSAAERTVASRCGLTEDEFLAQRKPKTP